jgi:CDP-glucose 4,6-dehydratase
MEAMVNKEFWQGRKVLITGHTGFKGSWLCMLLRHLNADIYGYALEPPTNPSLYKLCNIDSFVKSTIADIRDFSGLTGKIESCKPEIIIHMAAQPLVRLSYSEPMLTYQTNVMGTVNLFEAVRISKEQSTRVILNVTTDKCYENKEWVWAYRENEPLGGYDPYSNSKACSELVTSAYRNSFFNPEKYSEHKVAIATARAGNVIGGGDWAEDRLIPDIIRSIIQKVPVIIRSPEAIRPWQHVLEPLSGYLQLCEGLYLKGPAFSESWNFGPDENDAKSVLWIVMKICKLWGNRATFEIANMPQLHEALNLKLDCSKAKKILSWQPRWNLEKSIEYIVDFTRAYSENKSLKDLCMFQIKEYLGKV